MTTSPERGPGSNQHADKPPLEPREPSGSQGGDLGDRWTSTDPFSDEPVADAVARVNQERRNARKHGAASAAQLAVVPSSEAQAAKQQADDARSAKQQAARDFAAEVAADGWVNADGDAVFANAAGHRVRARVQPGAPDHVFVYYGAGIRGRRTVLPREDAAAVVKANAEDGTWRSRIGNKRGRELLDQAKRRAWSDPDRGRARPPGYDY